MPSASKSEEIASTVPDSGASPPAGRQRERGHQVGRRERSLSAQDLEARTQQIGRELFERIGRGPKPWQRAWWEERFIAGTLDDPLVRVQLFRFIDALPALKTTDSVRRHLAEYLAEAGDRVPWWLGLGLRLAPAGTQRAEWLAEAARASAGVMARKFIAGATPDEARQTVMALRARRLAFTADLLGEAVISEAEADLYQETCLALIRGLDGPLRSAAEVPLDRPRSTRPDSARQPLTQAVEPDGPVRRHPCRGDDRPRQPAPAADPPHGSRAGGLYSRRHGAIRLPGTFLRTVLPRARGARVPRLARRGDRRASLPRRCRERAADAPGMGRAPRRADHDPAGQGSLLGLRSRHRAAAGLARAGLSPESGKAMRPSSAAPGS